MVSSVRSSTLLDIKLKKHSVVLKKLFLSFWIIDITVRQMDNMKKNKSLLDNTVKSLLFNLLKPAEVDNFSSDVSRLFH